MSDEILKVLIPALASIVGAVIGASATIIAARISAESKRKQIDATYPYSSSTPSIVLGTIVVAILFGGLGFILSQPQNTPIPTPQTTALPLPSPSPSPTPKPVAQKVQWIPDNDGRGTDGLCINDNWTTTSNGPICRDFSDFVPWVQLKDELKQKVLPYVRGVPDGSTLQPADYNGHRNWIVQVIEPNGNEIANVWIGNDPKSQWNYDGLIRVGYPPDTVWATFQRYSDGSYGKQ